MKIDGNKVKALTGTIIVHALIVVALLFLALKTPLPLPKEQGVEVSIGTENPGNGSQVNASAQPKPEPEKVQKKKTVVTPPPKKAPQKDMTQNVEKAPSLPKKKPAEKKPLPAKKKSPPKPIKKAPKAKVKESSTHNNAAKQSKKVEKPKPVINQRALFKLSKNQSNPGRGINPGNNEMGSPHGIEQSKKVTGKGGKGSGISYSLGGRGAKFLAKPTEHFSEQGIVVVKIWVNPSGEVVHAQVSPKGTTVVNENLRHLAVQSALNSTFVSDPTAPAEQIGTITYTFILK